MRTAAARGRALEAGRPARQPARRSPRPKHTSRARTAARRRQGAALALLSAPPPMASLSSPRLLSSFLGDRLALSGRPLLLRSAAPGACPPPSTARTATPRLCPWFHRVGPEQKFAEMALACRQQAGDVSSDENAMQLGGYPI